MTHETDIRRDTITSDAANGTHTPFLTDGEYFGPGPVLRRLFIAEYDCPLCGEEHEAETHVARNTDSLDELHAHGRALLRHKETVMPLLAQHMYMLHNERGNYQELRLEAELIGPKGPHDRRRGALLLRLRPPLRQHGRPERAHGPESLDHGPDGTPGVHGRLLTRRPGPGSPQPTHPEEEAAMEHAPCALVEPADAKGTYAAQFTGKNRRKIRRALPLARGGRIPRDGAACRQRLDSQDQHALEEHARSLNSGGFLIITAYR